MNDKRHYLFVMWEGGGTVPPMLGIARRLVGRGHRVTVLGDPTIREEAENDGCSFVPWRRAPHRTTLRPEDDVIRDWEASNPMQAIRLFRDVFITDPAPLYAADTLEAIEQVAPDVVVADYVIFGGIIAAEKVRLPVVALVPNIWPIPTPGAPAFGPGLPPARTVFGRMRDAAMRALSTRMFNQALPSLNATRRQFGLSPLSSFFDQCLRCETILVLTSAAFDFAAAAVPSNVHYVGPVLDDPQWALSWQAPWPEDNDDPIVLVAFSSTFQNQGAVLRRVVDALAGLRVRALVTLGEMLGEDAVQSKGSVVVVRSAPHQEVLARASLLVTHCGHGTTLKALAAGVPMVCMPMGRDQNDTAARVVHAGAGLRLKTTASVEKIRAASQTVLRDPRYRLGAKRVADAIQDERRSIDPIAEIERIARAPRPNSSSKDGMLPLLAMT